MTTARARFALWTILSLPGLWMAVRLALAGDPWLPDYVAETGEWAARLIVIALCLTPLKHLFGNGPVLAFLLRHRRAIGVAAFLYTLAHLILYLVDMGALQAVLDEALIPSMLSGWAAFLLLVPLALTSNDGAMRALGKGWKRLQRLAYPAAVLTLLHWLWVHDGALIAWLHFAPLFLLQALRLFTPAFKQRKMT
ncbi:sulfite oxidase heme-binding subunit YedZ [Sphingomicrobium flavum]|uniref:sulfite oxidase heme-binding subunit YedZ n=1 Tax=Sphingomicrobium flavum TaxID=1229164 RepID=UPI0021AD6056|nr:ferric reductase-like transmembrane domain-containing protein [Sphingomicrobium flavum]